MDINESYAEQWLQNQGYTNIQFVTDTNSQPPDFIVNDSIAVEVRRLNWMFGNENTGLENVEKPLEKDIKSGLEVAQPPPPGRKIFVSCDLFGTDLPGRKKTIREVAEIANDYVEYVIDSLLQGQHPSPSRYETTFGMSISFVTGTNRTINQFQLMDVVAGIDHTGWIANESIDNINRCIVEKTNKIRDKHNLYSQWWLILVEHNVHPAALCKTNELQRVKDALTDTSLWSRIIILSNLNGLPEIHLI